MWMRHLREGGTLKEITQVLRIANSAVDDANRDFNDIKEEFKLYKDLVKLHMILRCIQIAFLVIKQSVIN